MMIDKKQPPKKAQKLGNGLKSVILAISIMFFIFAWELVARRDAAKAAAIIASTPVPTSTPRWLPTSTPYPRLADLPVLPPLPTVEHRTVISSELTAGNPITKTAVIAPIPAAPAAIPTLAPMAALPEMPAPPPPPQVSSGGGGGHSGGGGGGKSKSKGS